MRGQVVFVAAAMLAVVLSGCTGGATSEDDLAAAAEQLDVAATATTGVIRGVAVDEALRPVAGAEVQLAGGEPAGTATNEDGAFGFDGLAPGTYFLSISADGYHPVQQSAEVVAGVSDPEPLRVLLAAIPRADPFIETLSSRIFLSGSAWVYNAGVTVSSVTGEGLYFFSVEITPNGTVAQSELVWEMTSPLGETTLAGGGTYSDGDGVDTGDWSGPSPLVMRANATEGDDTADEVRYSAYAYHSAGVPAGLHANQAIDAFVNVFHNFVPAEGWSFVRDGAHPLPPA